MFSCKNAYRDFTNALLTDPTLPILLSGTHEYWAKVGDVPLLFPQAFSSEFEQSVEQQASLRQRNIVHLF